MFDLIIALSPIFIFIFILFLISSIKQINEYERGIKFTFGKFTGIMTPGWKIVFPIIQTYQKVDIRIKVIDVPEQEVITNDNISVKINAVVYFKLFDAKKAILEIENYHYAVGQIAQTTMRNVVGTITLDELLGSREVIANKIQIIVDKATDPWGVKVEDVELKDIALPESMKRIMARVAEAEREKFAVIKKAEGEKEAAINLSQAAKILSIYPGALHLRTLETLSDISADKGNTIFFAMPLEILEAFKGFNDKNKEENNERMSK